MVYGILKSWHDYTKKERTETIDRLIAEMLQAGVNSNKFHEILRSMEENSLTKSA
jgi:DNA-binding transcriptional regulator YhcF (GntR family)